MSLSKFSKFDIPVDKMDVRSDTEGIANLLKSQGITDLEPGVVNMLRNKGYSAKAATDAQGDDVGPGPSSSTSKANLFNSDASDPNCSMWDEFKNEEPVRSSVMKRPPGKDTAGPSRSTWKDIENEEPSSSGLNGPTGKNTSLPSRSAGKQMKIEKPTTSGLNGPPGTISKDLYENTSDSSDSI